ncbi:YggS family pyridoxal phosphate-dependent enzyme [Priestia taiwanensis]|uniref:Pyridoxal phosphate homeostasis protein n=1 Tax=Priestia taiwanensis TaxID=1347902 RepID=A0A917EQF1_9BACI|nr:YggS family pyridoxal phosphate-dependent enzyme [Priestia taiwanensis]MBM7362925.1 pyridoxal phosphate enzyme (YggS family) [Priestia taiwanensis]GGE66206.1 YggS family pyridoxal phosphate enzyme [Priestia taiwanensis]
MSIAKNVENVQVRVNEACDRSNRSVHGVTIIAVTKNVDTETAEALLNEGLTHLGENRNEPFLTKHAAIGEKASWHFIGSLQTRKVKQIINKIDYLHSLDRMSLAEEIEKRAEHVVKCFVQVKTSSEESKQGLEATEVVNFVRNLIHLEKVEVVGLMTMAPYTEDEEEIRTCFRQLKNLQEELQRLELPHVPCTELSMGMSNDFEIAVEEGATFIRLGTILVEE